MSKKLIKIPQLHNNDYDFFDVLTGLCNVKPDKAQLQKEQNNNNEKQENQQNNSNQLINTRNE
jgi:hypothetical protein